MNRVPLALAFALALAGCNDGAVQYVPKPPVAVIEGPVKFAPLDTATFDGSQSHSEAGPIAGYAWELSARPPGSQALASPAPGDPSHSQVLLDVSGHYQLRLTVTDARGMKGSTTKDFDAVPWQTIHVELTWDTNGTDLDVHMVSLEEGGSFFATPFDCYFDNTNPDWGVQGDRADDPSIDRDDVDGYGPETTSIDQPMEGGRYRIYVHVYDDHGVASTTATVRIYLNGELRWEGIQALAGNDIGWSAATIEWPSGAVNPDGQLFQYAPP